MRDLFVSTLCISFVISTCCVDYQRLKTEEASKIFSRRDEVSCLVLLEARLFSFRGSQTKKSNNTIPGRIWME